MQYSQKLRDTAKTWLHVINTWSGMVRREAEMRFGEPAIRGAVNAAGRDREEFMERLRVLPRRHVVSLYCRLGEEGRNREAEGQNGFDGPGSAAVISEIRWAQSQARERLWMTDS